jgi:hypothetical protein
MKARLAPGGVVIMNIACRADSLYTSTVIAIATVFSSVYEISVQEVRVCMCVCERERELLRCRPPACPSPPPPPASMYSTLLLLLLTRRLSHHAHTRPYPSHLPPTHPYPRLTHADAR